MNALSEISARQWLEASRQRVSIRLTQLAVEGFEFGPSWLMAISLIETSQVSHLLTRLCALDALLFAATDALADLGGC